MIWYNIIWHDMIWYNMIWYDMVIYIYIYPRSSEATLYYIGCFWTPGIYQTTQTRSYNEGPTKNLQTHKNNHPKSIIQRLNPNVSWLKSMENPPIFLHEMPHFHRENSSPLRSELLRQGPDLDKNIRLAAQLQSTGAAVGRWTWRI